MLSNGVKKEIMRLTDQMMVKRLFMVVMVVISI